MIHSTFTDRPEYIGYLSILKNFECAPDLNPFSDLSYAEQDFSAEWIINIIDANKDLLNGNLIGCLAGAEDMWSYHNRRFRKFDHQSLAYQAGRNDKYNNRPYDASHYNIPEYLEYKDGYYAF